MTILYIGLGMAMISGISAMMQIGRNVNNSMLLSALKQNEYYQSSLPSYDRSIMYILDNYSGPGDEVCSEVKGKINNNLIVHYHFLPQKSLNLRHTFQSFTFV